MNTAAPAAGLAAVALVAGCGGDDGGTSAKERYEQAVARVDRSLQAEEDQVDEQAERADSLPEQADAIDAMQRVLLEFVARLEEIRPPAEVSVAHEDWVEGLRVFAEEDLEHAESAARSNDPERVQEIMEGGFSPRSIERVNRARETFEAEGYDIGNLGAGSGE